MKQHNGEQTELESKITCRRERCSTSILSAVTTLKSIRQFFMGLELPAKLYLTA